jgi:hypothetical protein
VREATTKFQTPTRKVWVGLWIEGAVGLDNVFVRSPCPNIKETTALVDGLSGLVK